MSTPLVPLIEQLNPRIEQLIRLVNKFHQLESRPRHYGTPDLIYVSEIHLIDMAGRYPELNLSEYAARLGVTRGAVWQTARKLEQKGLAVRVRRSGSAKEVGLALTERGGQALAGFRQVIERKDASISAILANLTPQELSTFARLLDETEAFLDSVT